MRVEEQMTDLIAELNEATVHYEAGTPIMTDEEWDNMYFQLKELEKESGIQLPSSPTYSIITSVTSLEKVKHSHPMLSCDKTKNLNEILTFCERNTAVATLKLDGLSCSLTYQYGKLVRAETRGNGEIGEDVTHNAQFIKYLPLTIANTSEEFVVDGEVIVRVKDFEAYSENYSNPRALAVGGLRLLSSNESKKIPLMFVAWKLISGDFTSYVDELKYLDSLGFATVEFTQIGIKELDEEKLDRIIECLANCAVIYQYPIDGIVFRYNDLEYGESLGATGHHRRDMLAYKFYDEEYETKLLDIDWTMSKAGILTPVAIFDPVEIDGTRVERANMHNLNIIRQLFNGTPSKGQTIYVAKMNQIIPQITRVEELEDKSISLIPPSECPVCGTPTEENSSGQLCCPNPHCEGKITYRFDYYCSKKGMDIKGLSIATLDKLVSWGWLNEFADIYRLKDHRDEWIKKDGWGAASVDKILNAIEDSRETTLMKFIAALGIPFIGPQTAKMVCEGLADYESFKNQPIGALTYIKGISLSKAAAIRNFNYDWADEAVKYLRFTSAPKQEVEVEANESIAGKTFVITGRLNTFKNRDELVEKITSLGGKVSSSVTSKTDYLINNDVNSTSSKNKAAQLRNIPIISEEDFINLTSNK